MTSKKPSETIKREVNVASMSFLRGSNNYVWCTTSVLGKGATGAVYQGVNRHTGEPVAVKTFNQLSHMRPQEVQMREFLVLEKVNHENIVKLLAIEEEQEGRGKVIVMELCTGGSLFNILDDPENSHGLEEAEFLLVLKHLAAGMNHLRDNNLVHRDLKPGNIMKFIGVDGATVYKLTDFGAARELQDDQQFMSLYGTEEYLHPDLYERAVLRKPVGKSFGARVDLWSIGVTLYHVATGQLPFRPFGGRKNKETMYQITTEKSPGVISGVQTSENGPIEWSRELPKTCQLSLGLCKLVTPLLGGLLEVDQHKMWNFERFFTEVTTLLSKKVVHMFFVNRVHPLILYLDIKHKLEDFQSLVCEQTEVLPANQLLLLDNKLLSELVNENNTGKNFPATTPSTPVILFSKQKEDVTLHLPEIPSLKFPTFPNMVSVEHDATIGKSICAVGYAIKRRIEYFCRCIFLVEYSVFNLIEVIATQLKRLSGELHYLEKLTAAVSELFGQLVANHRRFLKMAQMLSVGTGGASQTLQEMLEDLVDTKVEDEKSVRESLSMVKQLHNRVVLGNQLRRQWAPTSNFSTAAIERAPNKAVTYTSKLRESWQHLLRDRAARTLTFNDEQFHLLEKMKMKETAKCLENLLNHFVTSSLYQTQEHLADWCKVAEVQRVQVEIEETDVEKHKDLLEVFQRSLSQTQEKYHQTLSELLSSVKDRQLKVNSHSDTSSLNLPTDECVSLYSKLDCSKEELHLSKSFLRQFYESSCTALRLLEENGAIIKDLKQLSNECVNKTSSPSNHFSTPPQ